VTLKRRPNGYYPRTEERLGEWRPPRQLAKRLRACLRALACRLGWHYWWQWSKEPKWIPHERRRVGYQKCAFCRNVYPTAWWLWNGPVTWHDETLDLIRLHRQHVKATRSGREEQ
jgi:hypothetical protein